jgi:hypothetical protein
MSDSESQILTLHSKYSSWPTWYNNNKKQKIIIKV